MKSILDRLNTRPKYKLYPLIFIGGFISLALQIHAGRLLNTYHGGSTITWGSVLSVFMITLGAGYYISGKTTDISSLKTLTYFGTLCTFSMIIPFLFSTNLYAVGDVAYINHPFFTSLIIYGLPSLVIGFFSPYAVEIIMEKDGTAAGDIYTIGTIGSIFGALCMTFYLLPSLGLYRSVLVMMVLLFISIIPLYLSIDIGYIYSMTLVFLSIVLIISTTFAYTGAFQNDDIVYQTQSQYHDIVVSDNNDVRYLSLSGASSSALNLNDRYDYVYDYYSLMHSPVLHKENVNDIDNVLVFGGGAGVLSNTYAEKYDAKVDVVEIDPEVKRVAHQYFNARHENVNWTVSDARVYAENYNGEKYDLILVDVYDNGNIPVHLTTQEFFNSTDKILDENGLIATNVIGSVNGDNGFITRSIARTMDSIYQDTQLYYFRNNLNKIQNVIVVSGSLNTNENTIRSRTRDRFTGGLNSSNFMILKETNQIKGSSEILRDQTVSQYELLPPEIRDFTYRQD